MPHRPPVHRVPWHRSREQRETERKAVHDEQRQRSAARGYSSDWQRLRATFLKHNPICCMRGCMADATDVDHITSVRDRPDLRLAWWNLRPLCHRHHSQRTAREQGFASSPRSPDGHA